MAEDWRAVWPSVVRDAETAGGYSPWINTRAQARAILAADAALKKAEGEVERLKVALADTERERDELRGMFGYIYGVLPPSLEVKHG